MCGAIFSKFLVENKVTPTGSLSSLGKSSSFPCFSQAAEISAKGTISFSDLQRFGSGSIYGSNPWTAFQVYLDCDESWTGKRRPKNLDELRSSQLTKEALLKRLAQAEKNRNIKLEETKRKAKKAHRSRRRRDKDTERQQKSLELSQKLSKAASNRQKLIEQVRDVAKQSSGSSRRQQLAAESENRTQQIIRQLEMRMANVSENRRRAVEEVVSKQKMREARARAVRTKALIGKVDAAVMCDEVDPSFYASDTDRDEREQELWDTFWGIHKEYQDRADG